MGVARGIRFGLSDLFRLVEDMPRMCFALLSILQCHTVFKILTQEFHIPEPVDRLFSIQVLLPVYSVAYARWRHHLLSLRSP